MIPDTLERDCSTPERQKEKKNLEKIKVEKAIKESENSTQRYGNNIQLFRHDLLYKKGQDDAEKII